MKTRFSLAILLFASLTMVFSTGCFGPARTPAQGAARGAAVGAVVGNQFRSGGSGARGRGAAIGAAAGMAVGGSRQWRSSQRYHHPHQHVNYRW